MKKTGNVQLTENIEILIQYRSIEAQKQTTAYQETIKYPVSIYIGEAIKTTTKSAFLPFIATIETKPNIAHFKIKGGIFIKGPPQTIKDLILPQNDKPPRIWPQIYQNILTTTSKLAKHLKLPAPKNLQNKEK